MASLKAFLLADDDRDDREMFCEALASIDVTVNCKTVENGREVFKWLKGSTESPGLIFLDVNMPVMDGWETLALLKKDENFKQIPVIMISTSSHKREIDMAAQLQAMCYLTKPTEYGDLTHVLKVIVANLDGGLENALNDLQRGGSPFIFTLNK